VPDLRARHKEDGWSYDFVVGPSLWENACARRHSSVAFRTKYENRYNHRRTHSSLGYRGPAQFVASCGLTRAGEAFRKEPESVIAFSSG
jgi:hypothetical protein